MKKFKGFTNQQTHTLLKEMGFTGPAQKDEMDAFLASSPRAAAKIGRYTDIARQRVEGEPLAPSGFAEGSEGAMEQQEEQEEQPPETTEKPDFVLKQGTKTPEVTEAATGLDEAQKAYSTSMGALTDAQLALSGATIPAEDASDEDKAAYEALQKAVDDADLTATQTQAAVSTAQKRFETTDVPSTGEALGKAISTPSAILSQPTVYGLEIKDNQLIDSTTGQVADQQTLVTKLADIAPTVLELMQLEQPHDMDGTSLLK